MNLAFSRSDGRRELFAFNLRKDDLEIERSLLDSKRKSNRSRNF